MKKRKFQKMPPVSGCVAWIMLGGFEDVDMLDFSGVSIHADYAGMDRGPRFCGKFSPVESGRPIDMGPVQLIPIIVPWRCDKNGRPLFLDGLDKVDKP